MYAAALTFLITFTISLIVLFQGHLHEDAYILYIYAENLAKGNGIVYFEGGPPAEGATDFLWMILLSAFNMIGINSGLGASILNSIGLSLSAYLISRVAIIKSKLISKKHTVILEIFVAILLFISPIASASYAGFSTAFYTSFIVLILYILTLKPNLIPLVPILGLTLGLIRPDGVILGVVFTIIGAYFYKHKIGNLKNYYINIFFCIIVGSLYFLWRYNYFGHLLPLPLYVKGSGNELFPGTIDNLKWTYYNFISISIVSILILKSSSNRLKNILLLLPSLILFAFLMVATQSQNVSFRFQAPLLITIFFIIALESKQLEKIKTKLAALKPKLKYVVVFVLIFFLSKQITTYYKETKFVLSYILNNEYINYFPHLLHENVTQKNTIALTEAGRFAYWLKGKKIDLVGFNTAETAINKASVDYLKEIKPDIIFIHVANSLTNQKCNDSKYCEVDLEYIKTHLNKNIYKSIDDWKTISNGVYRSPLVVYDFLDQSHNLYDLFLVKYENNFSHLYALKKDSNIQKNDFIRKLDMSFQKSNRMSYLQMIKN